MQSDLKYQKQALLLIISYMQKMYHTEKQSSYSYIALFLQWLHSEVNAISCSIAFQFLQCPTVILHQNAIIA